MKQTALIVILSFLLLSCKKDASQEPDSLPLPAPIAVEITGKNVLLLEFNGIPVTTSIKLLWNLDDSVTNFLPSGLSTSEKKSIVDSVQQELKRNGANMLVTDDESVYNNAVGIKQKFVVTKTPAMVVTSDPQVLGVAYMDALHSNVEVSALIFTSAWGFYVDGKAYNWPAITRTILHEYGHTAGLWHVPSIKQDWMHPVNKVLKNSFFGTSVMDENNNIINEQQVISVSAPKRMAPGKLKIVVN
jgi:predicted Zn-dependent protease